MKGNSLEKSGSIYVSTVTLTNDSTRPVTQILRGKGCKGTDIITASSTGYYGRNACKLGGHTWFILTLKKLILETPT